MGDGEVILPSDHVFAGLEPGFDVVVADAPWDHKSNSIAKPGRNPRRHYKTMSLEEIKNLPVRDVVAKEAVLFFWIPGQFMVVGAHIPIMKAWGFKPTAMGFVWVKLNPNANRLFFMPQDLATGPGHTTRKNAEFCIIGKRGRSLRANAGVHEVIIDNRREHSRKPEQFRDRVEQYVGPGRRILEMFSRHDRPGWTAWGDQVGLFNEEAA